MHIAKRKVPRRLVSAVRVLTFAEIQSGRLPPRTEIEHRRYGFIFYRGRLYADMDLPSFVSTRNIIIDQVYGQRGHLRGVGIIRKQSRGQVKVVFEPSQLRKVLLGDILVAPMTTPDFVAAARKAAAIVTDEGGVTCHAAILARELNITCVVGTRIATQVLHDGDFVEVDAAKGIVRKL